MKIRRTRFPAFTQVFYDKHRKLRCYFRRAGVRVPLPEPYFGDEFWRVYNDRLSGIEQPPQRPPAIGAQRVRSGSVAAMVKRFTGSQTFARLAKSTQAKYRRTLAPLAECLDYPIERVQTKHLKAWIAEKVDFPGAARDRFKSARALFAYAVDAGELEENPTLGIKPPRQRNVGARPWTADEVAQARFHALGTMARLAIEMGVSTGLRRSDLVRIGPQHVRDGVIRILQQKTGHPVAIPIGDELAKGANQGRLAQTAISKLSNRRNRV